MAEIRVEKKKIDCVLFIYFLGGKDQLPFFLNRFIIYLEKKTKLVWRGRFYYEIPVFIELFKQDESSIC